MSHARETSSLSLFRDPGNLVEEIDSGDLGEEGGREGAKEGEAADSWLASWPPDLALIVICDMYPNRHPPLTWLLLLDFLETSQRGIPYFENPQLRHAQVVLLRPGLRGRKRLADQD